ncbi:MAG: amino acid ABC transporter ATP-binding protein, partial [Clostridia bacterium]|nr:amino acid ABC transporter ATP-binding protein [Clostridia bacterium]
MIEVKKLTKVFGDLIVLQEVDLDIYKGEVVCIIGPSGGGKSTLLRCLNMLEEPSGGEIFFDGINITDKKSNINKLRQRIGMVFQQFNL